MISAPCSGLSYYFVEVAGTDMDLHSGSFGGSVHEPMNDLVWLMSQLIDVRGTILIPGIKEMVAPLTPEEEGLYDTIEFDVVREQQLIVQVPANYFLSRKRSEKTLARQN